MPAVSIYTLTLRPRVYAEKHDETKVATRRMDGRPRRRLPLEVLRPSAIEAVECARQLTHGTSSGGEYCLYGLRQTRASPSAFYTDAAAKLP